MTYSEGLKISPDGELLGIGSCTDEDIIIPNSVTKIGDYAFYDCANLTSIIIPDSVTEIGDSAFVKCSSLTFISIPKSVIEIGCDAFNACVSFESIEVSPYNKIYHTAGNCLINTATKELVAGCKNSIIPADGSVTRIGKGAFDGSSLTFLNIPQGVIEIGEGAFADCSSLTSITIPESVTEIGEEAFADCTSLTSIIIPESVTEVGFDVFNGCSSLTSIALPVSVTEIWNDAFHNCSSLISITIPENVIEIGCEAFKGCSNLTSITIPKSVVEIGWDAFSDCTALNHVVVPLYYAHFDKSWWEDRFPKSVIPGIALDNFNLDAPLMKNVLKNYQESCFDLQENERGDLIVLLVQKRLSGATAPSSKKLNEMLEFMTTNGYVEASALILEYIHEQKASTGKKTKLQVMNKRKSNFVQSNACTYQIASGTICPFRFKTLNGRR